MVRPFNAFATTLLIVGSGSVFVASGMDLAVTGMITPSACDPLISAGGVAD